MIVTSDEDLIRQLSLHKTPNTCIIDLDGNIESASIINNNNIVDQTFSTQLPQLVSTFYFQ